MLARATERYSEAEYLAMEAASPTKNEFLNGEILAMAGSSVNHALVQAALLSGLIGRLRGGPCQAVGSDLRVHTAETGLYAYPDLVVFCGAPELSPTNPPSLLNPRVIIEVLSDSTENLDRVVKVAHYRHRASVQTIVLVDSRRRLVEIQTRNPNGTWTLDERTSGEVPFAALDLAIPFDEVYERVTFEPVPPPAAQPKRRRRAVRG